MAYREELEKMAEIYEGIAIFGVVPGTTSHRAGVRAGDILVMVNGRRVRKLSDYAAARKRHEMSLELVVVRRGQKVTLWTGDAAIVATPTNSAVTCPWVGQA